jgi:hypothetical protein
MDPVTYAAFSDELMKTGAWMNVARSGAKRIGGTLKGLTSKGWRSLGEETVEGVTKPVPGGGWWTKRRYIPGMEGGRLGWKRRLPLGPKSFMVGTTAAFAPGAVASKDPYQMGRSRTERVTGLAAETLGGLAGAGAALKYLPRGKLRGIGGVGGLIGGGMGAHYLISRPFKKARLKRLKEQSRIAQPPEAREGEPSLPANLENTQLLGG